MIGTNFDFYDVSVIMPFYKKIDVFKITFLKNKEFLRKNGVEVVISMDSSEGKNELLHLISKHPEINFKLIVNEQEHGWRNPACAINVGIRHASFNYVLIMGPDSEMASDIIQIFRKFIEHYDNHFLVGRVSFIDMLSAGTDISSNSIEYLPYGSIFTNKKFLIDIEGYNETLQGWGGDDDEIRARLELSGILKIQVPEAILFHRDKVAGHIERYHRFEGMPEVIKIEIFLPSILKPNNGLWGEDFDKIVYEYKNNFFAYRQIGDYVKQFSSYRITTEAEFNKERKLICLIPAYNESQNLKEIIPHLEQICDGIIILDDGSEDDSFEVSNGSNVLLAVKRIRNGHNELDARNVLLHLASFFRSEWLFFMDADERFDPRFNHLRDVAEFSASSTVSFHLVHLWDDTAYYRTDIPEKSPVRIPGVVCRWRMFRKKGYLQISFAYKIHVPAIPYKQDNYLAAILVLHFGMLKREIRQFKKNLYTLIDPMVEQNQNKYSYFDDEQVSTQRVSAINISGQLFRKSKNI